MKSWSLKSVVEIDVKLKLKFKKTRIIVQLG